MDTDDLTDETYNAILIEAERFHHGLTLYFGLLAGDCANEKEFIEKSVHLINEIKQMDDDEIEDLFFGDPPSMAKLLNALNRISQNIKKISKQ